MPDFIQQRHKPLVPLDRPRELVIACAPLRSNVNLSRIVRAAGCMGVRKIYASGTARVVDKIARDAVDDGGEEADLSGVEIEVHRTLPPVLARLREEGYELVGLEQTTDSQSIFDFSFSRRTALVVGNERSGLDEASLRLVQRVVEIPMFGRPFALNVATATAMTVYEYCRQFPRG